MISTAINCNDSPLARSKNFPSYSFMMTDPTPSITESVSSPTTGAVVNPSFVAPSLSFGLPSSSSAVCTPSSNKASSPPITNRTLASLPSPFPPYVSKTMSEWSVEDVYEWSRQFLDEEDAERLRKQKIKGSSLIKVTEERLQSYGLPGGPAMDLLSAVHNIKGAPGQLPVVNPSSLRSLPVANPAPSPIHDDKDESRQIADFLQKLSQQKNNSPYHKDDSIEHLISSLERKVNEIAQNQEHLSFRVTKMQQEYSSALKQMQSPTKPFSPYLDHPTQIHIPEAGTTFPIASAKLQSPRMNLHSHFMTHHTTSSPQSIHSTPSPHDSNGNIILPVSVSTSTAIVNYVPPKTSITDLHHSDASFSRSPTPPSVESTSPRGRKRSATPESKSEAALRKHELKLLRKGPRNRVKWTPELIELFHQALRKLGDNAVPSAILDEMNIDGLTRENVASHLQKHRLQTAAKMKPGSSSPIPLPSSSHIQLSHPLHHLN